MAALAMYASGIAPGRNTCATGLNFPQNSPPAASAIVVLPQTSCPHPDQRPPATTGAPALIRGPVAGAQRVTAGNVAGDNCRTCPDRTPCPALPGAGA